jgi:hypothetical protein
MIEVQVGQNDNVDVASSNTELGKRVDKDVPVLLDTETLTKLWFEERTNPGLEQDVADRRMGRPTVFLHEQSATCERDAIALIGRRPLLPNRTGTMAEHRTAVETLRVAFDRANAHGLNSKDKFLPW